LVDAPGDRGHYGIRMRKSLVAVFVLAAWCVAAAAAAAPSGIRSVSTTLTAAPVTPKSTSTGRGRIVVKLDTKHGQACWTITLEGVGRLLSAHVHKGKPGKLGPVVLPLGDRYEKKGCVIAKPAVVAAVAKSPKAYYVDIHTARFVNGALRGQLHAGA